MLVVALAGCGGGGNSASAPPTTTTTAAPPAQSSGGCTSATKQTHSRSLSNEHLKLDPNKTYKLVFTTNCGTFTVTLNQQLAPNATGSLVSLAKRGFFDDTFFHRIVPGFVIQGGDPTGSGTGGPGYETHDTVPADTKYTHGVVAMAKTATEAAGTAGSQFFIVTVRNAGLPPDYAIIGKVIQGLDVVDHIGTLGDASQQPTQVVQIQRATVRVH